MLGVLCSGENVYTPLEYMAGGYAFSFTANILLLPRPEVTYAQLTRFTNGLILGLLICCVTCGGKQYVSTVKIPSSLLLDNGMPQ